MANIFNDFELLDLINLDEMMWDSGPTSFTLVIDNSTHALTSENIVLDVGSILLDIQNASHALSSDNLDLSQIYILAIANAVHALSSENIVLSQAHLLVIQNAIHALTSDNITFGSVLSGGANLYTVHAMETLIRTILNEPSSAILSSAEILRALNDGYKDVSRLAFSIENVRIFGTVPGNSLVKHDAYRVNQIYFGNPLFIGGGDGSSTVRTCPPVGSGGPGGGSGGDGGGGGDGENPEGMKLY